MRTASVNFGASKSTKSVDLTEDLSAESETLQALKKIRQQAQHQNYVMQKRKKERKPMNMLPQSYDPAQPGKVIKAHHTATKDFFTSGAYSLCGDED